jgi:hypothetical protein
LKWTGSDRDLIEQPRMLRPAMMRRLWRSASRRIGRPGEQCQDHPVHHRKRHRYGKRCHHAPCVRVASPDEILLRRRRVVDNRLNHLSLRPVFRTIRRARKLAARFFRLTDRARGTTLYFERSDPRQRLIRRSRGTPCNPRQRLLARHVGRTRGCLTTTVSTYMPLRCQEAPHGVRELPGIFDRRQMSNVKE